jgi:purine nucleoside phosphorylase
MRGNIYKHNSLIWKYNETVHQLFVDFKKAYDSVSRAVLYNILKKFGAPMKLVRLIKMCLLHNEGSPLRYLQT